MTKIKYRDKPVWHETGETFENSSVLVAEEPDALLLRLKGTRQTLRLPWRQAYIKAAFLAADLNVARRKTQVRRGVLI